MTELLPTGTVTLLLADVEGSTRLWQNQPEEMTAAMAQLDRTVSHVVAAHGGVRPIEQGEGDSFVAAFSRASDAVAAALELQRAPLAPIRLRIGLHTGEVQLRDEGNRTARLRDLAHGGQTVLSGATEEMVVDRLPAGAWLTDLGTHQLRDLPRLERVVQLCHPELRNHAFSAPRIGEQSRWQQPAPPPEPPAATRHGPQGQPMPGEPGRPVATPPTGWNFVESIPATELVPTRPVPPGRGWRRAIYKATFGLINLGQSPAELRQAELEAKVRTPLRGRYKIGVLGKGGVGKTSVAVSVGSIFAQLRHEDRVVAIDADSSFGNLGARVDPHTPGSYSGLAADEHLDSFADVRARVGNNADGLFVLPGESAAAQRRVLDPAIYREAASRLDRHFTISIVDCGSTMDSQVTHEVLRDIDALIVVSSPWVDGASVAAQTMEWLASRGMTDLLYRTVVVLNDSDGHANKRTRTILAEQFASRGQVVIQVPFDPHLRPGGVIDVKNGMSPNTRRRFYEIAAAIADHFSSTSQGRREQ